MDSELIDYKDTSVNEVRYNCPFCPPNEDYKLYVKVANDKTDGLWQCKKCSSVGNPVSFVMKYNGVDFKTAKDILELYGFDDNDFTREAKERGVSIEEYLLLLMREKDKVIENAKNTLTPPPLPIGYKRIVDNLQNPEVVPFVNYLINVRGYTVDDIILHNIGYITNGYAVSSKDKKIPLNNHVVFLTHDNNGNYQYWNTRSIDPEPYIKSFNGLADDNQYSKRNTVFNLNRARYCKDLVLVEGVTDALTVGEQGIATFGKQVTNEQVELILANIQPEQNLFIMLDRDADTEASKLADKIQPKHKNTYIVLNPTGQDANSLGRVKTWEIITQNSKIASPENLSLLFL